MRDYIQAYQSGGNMIPTMLQRELNGSWQLSNANLIMPLEEAVKTCSEKCKTIAALLSRIDARSANALDFRIDLAILTGRVKLLIDRVNDDKKLDSIDDYERNLLRTGVVQIAACLSELKDKNANNTPFKSDDFSAVNKLIEELGGVLGEVPKELISVTCIDHRRGAKEAVEQLNADLEASLGLVQLLQYSYETGFTMSSDSLRKIKLENPQTIKELSTVLVPLLQSASRTTRDLASDVLTQIYPELEELENVLVPLLKVPDRDLVIRVARILQDSRFIIRGKLADLLDGFLQKSRDIIVFRSVCFSIRNALSVDPRDLAAVVSLLENPDEKISSVMCALMAMTIDDMRLHVVPSVEIEFCAALMQLLSSDLVHVRKHALSCLKSRKWFYSHPGLEDAILAFRDDPDPTVREP